jgi:hypothetical protein
MTGPRICGPYVVTHRHLPEHDGATGWERRRAVATLESAAGRGGVRQFIDEAILSGWHPDFFPRTSFTTHTCLDIQGQIRALTGSGGSISLPDGNEIVVEATTWQALGTAVAQLDGFRDPASAMTLIRWAEDGGQRRQGARDTILAAYNARFGTAAQEATS